MHSLWKDVLYAGRTLRRNPGFAAVAILSLALGIGANSAIFSFADCLMFRPMQVPRTGEVVSVFTTSKSEPMGEVSYRDYVEIRDNARTLAGLAAYKMTPVGLSRRSDSGAEPGDGRHGELLSGTRGRTNAWAEFPARRGLGRAGHACGRSPRLRGLAAALQ